MMPIRRNRTRALAAGSALMLAPLLAACGGGDSHHGEGNREALPPVAVRTAVLEAGTEPAVVTASGEVVARNRVEIASRIGGRILEIPVAEGTPVRRGDVLVRIDSPELSAALVQAKSGEELARAAFEIADRQAARIARLAAESVVTARDKELADLGRADAESALRRAEAARRMAEESLSYAVLRAPQDGVVVSRPARPGDFAAPGIPILVVEDRVQPEIRVTLPSDPDTRPFPGMSARILSDAVPESARAATVARVAPNAEMHTVVAWVSADDIPLPTGTFVDVALELPRTDDALRVPAESLVRRGPLTGVFVVSDGRALLRWLRLDAAGRVLAGVAPGERVVLDPPADLRDGSPVEVRS